jgi:hypothetical protein
MATPFNQGVPSVPVVLNTSNCFVFGNTASGNALSVQQLGTGNVATFRTTTGATALFVNAAGNVGVGTTRPSGPLQVSNAAGTTIFTVNAQNIVSNTQIATGGNGTLIVGNLPLSKDPAAGYDPSFDDSAQFSIKTFSGIGAYGVGNLRIGVSSNTSTASLGYTYIQGVNTFIGLMPISLNPRGANVGIGTVNPGYPLEVSGAAYMSGTVYVGTTNTDPTFGRLNGINLRSDGRFFSRSSGHSLGIDSTSGTQIQFWTDNGSNRVATGAITSSGSTTSYTSASDYRLKENVQPITMAMDVIARLRPVTYTWKSDGSPGHGFIAHELQEVVPDAVVGEKDAVDSDGNIKPQGIDKSYLVSYLTAAIQELSTKNAALEARLAALEGIVGSLVPPAPPS